ncbi:hypothetical protein [Rhizobium esperanzae]|uniref:hypothetical protein n=1 Tax=Rhizobium esperanzae TaxID=1967781 RepID=UPI001611C76E|nr:hypothetical protein [Rhizobium esperanzae]
MARVALPRLLDDLRRREAQALVVEGELSSRFLPRERQALHRPNARQGRIVQFYDDLTTRYGTNR